ncbi:MAG: hypothetical protein WKF36_07090 [Candidatus Nitrosocosmicus sp.]
MVELAFVQQDDFLVLSQNKGNNDNKSNTWISIQNNLNITMSLEPAVPIIDQKTKIAFDVRKLNGSSAFKNLNARTTITDHDGRLFKLNIQPVSKGKFSVDYLFPDDGQHRIIVQLYKNTTAFTLGSFDITIPHPQPAKQPIEEFFSNLFKRLLNR